MEPELSDWTIERLALGELPPDRLAALQARVARDPALRARLDALRADNAAFLEAHPPEVVLPALRMRAGPANSPMRRWAAVGVPLLAAALGLWMVRTPEDPALTAPTIGVAPVDPSVAPVEPAAPATPAAPEPTRVKGDAAQLRVYRAADRSAEPLPDGASAAPGDVLQLTYAARGYGVIVSIDGRGTVTPHLGAPGAPSPALDPDGAVALPDAYELDDAPAFERFLLVTADAPFPADVVFAAARTLAARPARAAHDPLPLPAGLAQRSVLLSKELP